MSQSAMLASVAAVAQAKKRKAESAANAHAAARDAHFLQRLSDGARNTLPGLLTRLIRQPVLAALRLCGRASERGSSCEQASVHAEFGARLGHLGVLCDRSSVVSGG